MQLINTLDNYGLVSRILHWALALLILGLVWLGWVMMDMGYYDPWYQAAITAHETLGMLVLALAAFKLVWMAWAGSPAAQPELKPWERAASGLAHWVLILMMVVIPVTGYLTSTSDGAGVMMFDWFEVPALVPVSTALRDWSIDVHYYAAYGVFYLAILHAAAALKHQFIDGHRTLRRMI